MVVTPILNDVALVVIPEKSALLATKLVSVEIPAQTVGNPGSLAEFTPNHC